MKFQFHFATEFLNRFQVIDSKGQPVNFAPLIAHLFWTEPSNFIFVDLLRRGTMLILSFSLKLNTDIWVQ